MPNDEKSLLADDIETILHLNNHTVEKKLLMRFVLRDRAHYEEKLKEKEGELKEKEAKYEEKLKEKEAKYEEKLKEKEVELKEKEGELKEKEAKYEEELKEKEAKYEEKLKEKEGELMGKKRECEVLNITSARVMNDAALGEFLLFTRDQIALYEKYNCKNLPSDKTYTDSVLKLTTKIQASQFNGNIHFKKWLWILLSGDEMKDESIEDLRNALGSDHTRYLWFANQMQSLFDVISMDIHGRSPLFIKHMEKENFHLYVQFFTKDIREAVEIFLENVF